MDVGKVFENLGAKASEVANELWAAVTPAGQVHRVYGACDICDTDERDNIVPSDDYLVPVPKPGELEWQEHPFADGDRLACRNCWNLLQHDFGPKLTGIVGFLWGEEKYWV